MIAVARQFVGHEGVGALGAPTPSCRETRNGLAVARVSNYGPVVHVVQHSRTRICAQALALRVDPSEAIIPT